MNWAILHGESETGATLHHMVARADAGAIVDQQAIPILGDDTAFDVMRKVTVASELVLVRSLPRLIAGDCSGHQQDLQVGHYFGRRHPEDGRIDWAWSARRIHNLVRAVAPPYPGAFFDHPNGQRWWVHRTRLLSQDGAPRARARLIGRRGQCVVQCVGGGELQILQGAESGIALNLDRIAEQHLRVPLLLGPA